MAAALPKQRPFILQTPLGHVLIHRVPKQANTNTITKTQTRTRTRTRTRTHTHTQTHTSYAREQRVHAENT